MDRCPDPEGNSSSRCMGQCSATGAMAGRIAAFHAEPGPCICSLFWTFVLSLLYKHHPRCSLRISCLRFCERDPELGDPREANAAAFWGPHVPASSEALTVGPPTPHPVPVIWHVRFARFFEPFPKPSISFSLKQRLSYFSHSLIIGFYYVGFN